MDKGSQKTIIAVVAVVAVLIAAVVVWRSMSAGSVDSSAIKNEVNASTRAASAAGAPATQDTAPAPASMNSMLPKGKGRR